MKSENNEFRKWEGRQAKVTKLTKWSSRVMLIMIVLFVLAITSDVFGSFAEIIKYLFFVALVVDLGLSGYMVANLKKGKRLNSEDNIEN